MPFDEGIHGAFRHGAQRRPASHYPFIWKIPEPKRWLASRHLNGEQHELVDATRRSQRVRQSASGERKSRGSHLRVVVDH
jgi:hypothetical protein